LLLAELGLSGEVSAESEAPKTPAHQGDESLELRVVGEAPGCGGVVQEPEVVVVGYVCASPSLAQVA